MPFRVRSEKIEPSYLLIFATQPADGHDVAEIGSLGQEGLLGLSDCGAECRIHKASIPLVRIF